MAKGDDKPPSYCETAPADASSIGVMGKAVFRLRIWHYCVTRWSVAHNNALARQFRDLNLEDWIVQDAAYIFPGENSERDDYVPVEVRHHPPLQDFGCSERGGLHGNMGAC